MDNTKKQIVEANRKKAEKIKKVKWLNLKVVCPFCGRVNGGIRIKATETESRAYICNKCESAFEWTYYYPTPNPRGRLKRERYPRYGYVESRKTIFIGDLPETEEYNEKYVKL